MYKRSPAGYQPQPPPYSIREFLVLADEVQTKEALTPVGCELKDPSPESTGPAQDDPRDQDTDNHDPGNPQLLRIAGRATMGLLMKRPRMVESP